jgi:hypothetical protein
MYEETKKVSFDNAELYIRGQISTISKNTPVHILFKVIDIKNEVATDKKGKKYKLLNKLDNYMQFEQAVEHKIPIVYDWFIGKDQNNDLRISGVLYEEGLMNPISEKIKSQEIENSTLNLGSGDTVFVVWGSMNDKFIKHLKTILNIKSEFIFIEKPIDIFLNKDKFPDLLNLNDSIIEKNQMVLKRAGYYRSNKKN